MIENDVKIRVHAVAIFRISALAGMGLMIGATAGLTILVAVWKVAQMIAGVM